MSDAGKKLTKAQKEILREGNSFGGVNGEAQRRRTCERLAKAGLMERGGLRTFYTTEAGRAAINGGAK